MGSDGIWEKYLFDTQQLTSIVRVEFKEANKGNGYCW
jgi:hypothetical protein